MDILKKVYYKEIPCCILNSSQYNSLKSHILQYSNLIVVQYNINLNRFFEMKLESYLKKYKLTDYLSYFYGEEHEYVIYNKDNSNGEFCAKCVILHRTFFKDDGYYNIQGNNLCGIISIPKYTVGQMYLSLKFDLMKNSMFCDGNILNVSIDHVLDRNFLKSQYLNTSYMIGKCLGYSDLEIRNYVIDKSLIKMNYEEYKEKWDKISVSIQFKYLINTFINLTKIDDNHREFTFKN